MLTGVPQATGIHPWGSAPSKRLKTNGVVLMIQFLFLSSRLILSMTSCTLLLWGIALLSLV